MRSETSIFKDLDWITVFLFITLAVFGWLNIYAAIYSPEVDQSAFAILENKAGTQFLWLIVSTITIIIILIIDFKFYFSIPWIVYALCILLLLLVLTPLGTEINGNKSWIKIGSMSIQPAEFAKIGVALIFAKMVDLKKIKYELNRDFATLLGLIFFPAILVLLQPDTGSALVFSSFIIVMYADGLNPLIPLLGIVGVAIFVLTLIFGALYVAGVVAVIALTAAILLRRNMRNVMMTFTVMVTILIAVFGTDFFFHNVLQDHQRMRIVVLLGEMDRLEENIKEEKKELLTLTPDSEEYKALNSEIYANKKQLSEMIKGPGWNISQSKIAIGSGGAWGKGYMKGTITKFDFVPEQHTDFIFCTIGEEHGWIGSLVVISLYVALLTRLVSLAERQKSKFARTYGYAVASILFFHFTVNIGMTIGLFPVIGIPLPFFSYGGSSLWSFTILLFVFLKLDMHRNQILARG